MCLQLNMFRAFSLPSSGARYCSGSLWFYLRIVVTVVLCLWSGRLARPQTLDDYHHDTKVKPEAATAFIELLMMGGKTPETCWAVNKRQDNKLKNCCVWLVIYLNCTMMHGLTNLKTTVVFSHRAKTLRLTVVLSGKITQVLLKYRAWYGTDD